MRNRIFYFKKFRILDYSILILYSLISFFIVYRFIYNQDSISHDNYKIVFFYGFFTQMIIYQILYPTIRNFGVYIFWILVGLAHLILFFYLQNIDLNSTDFYNTRIFRNSIIMILVLQIFRIVSLNLTGQEFIAPLKLMREDLYGERNRNFLDLIFLFVYYGLMIGLIFI